MPKFYNRFNPAPCKNRDKVYDRHDEVDRLSYVDNTLMVQRFINEGKSLMAARAQALRSGSFTGSNMKEIENDNSIPIPVYGTDPAIAQAIIDQAVSRFEAASVAVDNVTSNDATSTATEAANASSAAN